MVIDKYLNSLDYSKFHDYVNSIKKLTSDQLFKIKNKKRAIAEFNDINLF